MTNCVPVARPMNEAAYSSLGAGDLEAIAEKVEARIKEYHGLPLGMIVLDTMAADAGFDDETLIRNCSA